MQNFVFFYGAEETMQLGLFCVGTVKTEFTMIF